MSRIFKRPMFRKGGNVGEGIMTGIVDRENYDIGTTPDPFVGETDQFAFNTPTYKGIDIPSLKDLTAEKRDLLLEAAGDRGGFDPITKFLLTYGPAVATQTGGGGNIGNLLAASKVPLADLIKDKEAEDKFQRDIKLKSAGAAITQRDRMIEAESDKKFKFDLAKAQERLQRDLTTQEIKALKLRADKKVKDDIELAIKRSELDTERGIKLLKEKETLEKLTPEEKVETYGPIFADKEYGGDQEKGKRRANYEYIIAPKINENFGIKSNGGSIEIDTTNLEKTNKLMKKKIKAGGLNKYFHNINDGVTYLLTEQGLVPINLDLPAAENVVPKDINDDDKNVDTEKSNIENVFTGSGETELDKKIKKQISENKKAIEKGKSKIQGPFR
jgi:hypothetical protein|tara:strand:- start:2910 stop:4070 length:1161 start_codon:yes stop_codon:yes gene_type:complete